MLGKRIFKKLGGFKSYRQTLYRIVSDCIECSYPFADEEVREQLKNKVYAKKNF